MFKTLEFPGGFVPLAPLPGFCPGPTGGHKRPPDPSPNNFASPFLIPGYGPDDGQYLSIFNITHLLTGFKDNMRFVRKKLLP